MPFRDYYCFAYLALCFLLVAQNAGAENFSLSELSNLSIEELLDVNVSTPFKYERSARDVPAGTTVLTQEHIQSSAATTIPELLRQVPGVHVAQIDSNKWAVAIRGRNSRFASRILVLVDSRIVYSSLFGGTYWELQDLVLADIDRIEIIRGPNGSLWGANAVDGMIHIYTKNSADTHGFYSELLGGSVEHGRASIRFGEKLGEHSDYRIWAKAANKDSFDPAEDRDFADDRWKSAHAGFRIDGAIEDDSSYFVTGDLYRNRANESSFVSGSFDPSLLGLQSQTSDAYGGHVKGQWKKSLGHNRTLSVDSSVAFSRRDELVIEDRRLELDQQIQLVSTEFEDNTLVAGLRAGVVDSHSEGRASLRFHDSYRTDDIYNLFVQNVHEFWNNSLLLTTGVNLEYNEYSNFEIHPTLRTLYKVSDSTNVWAGVSHAARSPAQNTQDFDILFAMRPTGPDEYSGLLANNIETDSEKATAFETGVRHFFNSHAFLDITGFYIYSDDVLFGEANGQDTIMLDDGSTANVLVNTVRNNVYGGTYGAELALDLRPFESTAFDFGYTYLKSEFKARAGSGVSPTGLANFETGDPEHIVFVNVTQRLAETLSLIGSFYFVDTFSQGQVAAYERFDFGLIWLPTPDIRVSLHGLNLFDPEHQEFESSSGVLASQVPRSGYVSLEFSL